VSNSYIPLRLSATLALLLASLSIQASLGWGQNSAPTPPGQVDVQRSRSFVRVEATGLGHEHGVVGKLLSGTIHLGAAQRAGELVFDTKSFLCDTLESRKYVSLAGDIDDSTQKKTTANMLGADVLNVAHFPKATYAIRSALATPKQNPSDPQWYQLDGDFTLHGVTRPLKINVLAEPGPGVVRLRGQFKISQTQFGITPYSKLFGSVGVADELTIWGDVWIGAE